MTALVTGVSRGRGIGRAVVERLRSEGIEVHASGWSAYDATEPWGADGAAPVEVDLEDPAAPARLVAEAAAQHGRLDALVVVHARSSSGGLAELTADELDRAWAVNVRATLLLVQAFVAQCPDGGRVVLFTSGQHRAAMAGELAYAVTKGAVAAMTLSLADAVADRGITVNCVNPGPVDTGWASPQTHEQVRRGFPSGRWTSAEQVAGVVSLLLSPLAQTITGQVLDAEAGFRRG